jgi:hypothetical protein
VGTPRAPLSLGLVTLRLLRKGNRWRVDDARAETRRVGSFRRHQETSVLLAQAVSEFCSVGQRVLGSGRVDPPLDRTGFVRYVLEVVRRELRTDLAVVSEDSLTMGPEERLEGPVTSGFLTRSFARNEMVELSVLGQDLGGFVSAYHAASNGALRGRLHLVGARVLADGTVEVNNRPLNAKRRYTIAATDFLASGGRSYLSGLLAAEATRRTPTRYFLQELVLRFFDKDRFATEPGDRTIALDRNFADLWDRPLWEFSLGLNGSVSNVSIENPAEYAETQLTSRSPNTGVKGDGQFLVTISTRDHRVSDFLKAQYGMVQVGEGPFDETQDLITEEILYSWTRWRNRTGEGRFWIPAPLVKGKLETEFSGAPTTWAKDGDGNEILDAEGLKVPEFEPYHHLEVTGVAGIEWLFGSKASAGLGYGFRSELLATEGSGRDGVHAGVEVYYQINKLPLYSWSAVSGITLDSRFELFLSDWTDERTLKSSGSTRLVASVLGPLSFTLGFDFFLFRTGDEGLAYAFDTTVGLAFSYDAAVQQF